MRKETCGHAAAITANVIFGLNILVTKAMLSSWMSPLGYTTTRMIFGLLVFWALSLFFKREKVEPRDLPLILVCGFIGIALTQAGFAAGIRFTSPVTFSLIGALSPIVVLFLSAVFLKEPVTRRKGIGALLGLSGAALVILGNSGPGSSSNTPLGIGIAIASVSSYAGYLIMVRKISAKYSPVTMMKWMFVAAVLVILPFGCSELPKQRIYSPAVELAGVLELGFALVFSSILAFFLIPVALKRIKAASAGIYTNLQPVVASVFAIIIGQDFFSWEKPIALFLVVAGVFLVTREQEFR
jgi:drug/metabolite transporter (DMT)-like permease